MAGTCFTGTCHCGNIGYRFFPADDSKGLSPRKCGCGFCTRHGNVYVSDPKGRLEISIGNAAAVNRYAFGHRTAQFLVCKTCGVVPAVISEIDDHLCGAVNANLLDPPLDILVDSLPVGDFDGEDVAARLARRSQNWIGDVTITETEAG